MFANKHVNPYIEIHKKKWQNEKDYNEYINWLDKSKMYDMPIKKIKTIEDKIFENKIHDAIK